MGLNNNELHACELTPVQRSQNMCMQLSTLVRYKQQTQQRSEVFEALFFCGPGVVEGSQLVQHTTGCTGLTDCQHIRNLAPRTCTWGTRLLRVCRHSSIQHTTGCTGRHCGSRNHRAKGTTQGWDYTATKHYKQRACIHTYKKCL